MILQNFQPSISHIEENKIEVGNGVFVPEQKMGLTLFGPPGTSESIEINVGLIGDSESIEKTKDLIERFNITSYGKDQTFLHVSFPGLDRLRIRFKIKNIAEISEEEVKRVIDLSPSPTKRIGCAAILIKEKVKSLSTRDPSPDVIILAYPKKIDEFCVEAVIGNKKAPKMTELEKEISRKRMDNKTLDIFATELALKRESEYESYELRSLVKSICMEFNIPIQILRPKTTEPYNPQNPKREDDATTFWNLVVAIFYKSNHLPWKVDGLMEDTCYIGITFFRDRKDPSIIKTTLAQVFSLDMEGFVFKGDKALFNSETKSLHVPKGDALIIIKEALESYKQAKNGVSPKRLVIHKTSRFSQDEREGFMEGAAEINKVDLISFGTREIKLIRWGKHPPIRGTMVRLPDRSILLYTFGYIPYLGTYPGPRVPSPLEILEHFGKTPKEEICKEILALTRLNWNNAKFCSKAPITIAFAKRVASILKESPKNMHTKNKLKFYM